MSKSYNNIIPIFCKKDDLRQRIMKIKTDSKEPGEPKETDESSVFRIYQAFATDQQTKEFKKLYNDGIAWGEAKELLFELLEEIINPFIINYQELVQKRDYGCSGRRE